LGFDGPPEIAIHREEVHRRLGIPPEGIEIDLGDLAPVGS
jgi:sRNA-binding carbon storage regulator CsrA